MQLFIKMQWLRISMVLTIATLSLASAVSSANEYRPDSNPSTCLEVLGSASKVYGSDRIYPAGIDRTQVTNSHIQMSYETEYVFGDAAALLRDYAPDEAVMARSTWNALSDEQRVAWIKNKFPVKPEYPTPAGLKRAVDLPQLPEELIVDSTGNIELVINPPLNTLSEWNNLVNTIVTRYGPGSQQATVSKPREAAFAKPGTQEQTYLYRQHLGWLIFTNLMDMFQKLDSGADRYKSEPTKLTALSFDHPFLGPMTKVKRDRLEEFLNLNAEGLRYDLDSKNFVRKSDASFKYTSGPSYRPDIAGQTRFTWEIRNSHKNLDDLRAKLIRDLQAHESGLKPYAAFADVPAFDTLTTFEALPSEVRKNLKTLFPSKADPRFDYNESEHLALEVYRNFALPNMNLMPLVAALAPSPRDAATLRFRINSARVQYIQALVNIARDFNSGRLSSKDAQARIMGELGLWSQRSKLSEAFSAKLFLMQNEESVDRQAL